MAAGSRYLAFWSYSRFDDNSDDGWLTNLREALVTEIQQISGKHVEIFQDTDGIEWGERWQQKLTSSSDKAIFLIPIITPSYFESKACRSECR